MSLVLTSLERLVSRVINFAFERWLQNPQSFLTDISTLSLVRSCRLKHIPISNQLRLVFSYPSEGDGFWKDKFVKAEDARLNPNFKQSLRSLRVLAKLVRALVQGLRLEHDSRVSVGYADCQKLLIGKTEPVVVPGCGENESREVVDKPRKLWGVGFNTEHLERMVWDLTLTNSGIDNASYCGNGKIAMEDHEVHLAYTDEELATTLAHEIGHGVAMHIEGDPQYTFWPFLLIPWTSSFWASIILLRVCDLVLYMKRRHELEAWYIGLMLMASAGYDPRLVPDFVKKLMEIEWDDDYKCLLETTHPRAGRVAEMLRQERVMDKAVEIYEKVRAGGEVPSFVGGGERNFCSRLFNPFSVTQFFSEFKRDIGYGVAMHIEGDSQFAFLPLLLIPWTSSFWSPVIFLHVCDLMLYMRRRHELEA
ncbi:mitochondrial metalloendopeptidase OMA1 [Striga asiatica]|uniref:Mitochondrial metalloendopeptidase OMA1 n=1 Tax=Striga asiatica TaxID=4170 RepID=A0A5A7QMM4_STRAF|nr:mitochondrial metalloendopeptidase OMA1 [Striga asiatica]